MTAVVIGSGPAGVAAAQALCDAGLHVTVLDAGDRIEPGRMELFDTLARTEPNRWPPDLPRRARSAFPVDVKHVPRKPAYGSLFLYADADPDLPLACKNADVLSSLAYGGLSNAWGASMLPFRQPDIEDWPISLADLKPHYEAVLRFVPIAAERDELSEILPLYTDAPGPLRRNQQAKMILDHMRRHAPALKAAGFTFGASRLAVAAAAEDPRHCRHSGMCLYGCPYRSVYNAAHTLDALVREGKVDYRGGIYVDRLTEAGEWVVIDFHERRCPTATGRLRAARVFVACGTISSTRIMLESMGRARLTRRLRDSLYFTLPMATSRAAPVSVETQGNTLAQVFVEFEDTRICEHMAHLQIYGYNDIMLSALAKRLPLGPSRIERGLRSVLGRLVFIQGFLHSTDSPGLTVACDGGRVRVVGDEMAVGAVRARRLVRRLAACGRLLGMVPVPGLLHVEPPGKSNHLGGSLPMRRRPGELETDTLGRVPAWERVHVVDASVFPSFPATTVTISIMANAHRIATAAATLEAEGIERGSRAERHRA
jgi:choline dehydrogenase-like flavoprotein